MLYENSQTKVNICKMFHFTFLILKRKKELTEHNATARIILIWILKSSERETYKHNRTETNSADPPIIHDEITGSKDRLEMLS